MKASAYSETEYIQCLYLYLKLRPLELLPPLDFLVSCSWAFSTASENRGFVFVAIADFVDDLSTAVVTGVRTRLLQLLIVFRSILGVSKVSTSTVTSEF